MKKHCGVARLGTPVEQGAFSSNIADVSTAEGQWLLGSGKPMRCRNGGGSKNRAIANLLFEVRNSTERKVSSIDAEHLVCADPTRIRSNRAMSSVISGVVRLDTTMKSTAELRSVRVGPAQLTCSGSMNDTFQTPLQYPVSFPEREICSR